MPQLIAVHEIHRPGKNGKPEVITPGKSFKATEAEVKQLVEVFGAARLPLEEDRLPAATDNEDEGGNGPSKDEVKVEDMTVAQLKGKAKALGLELPTNAQKPEILKLVQEKIAADAGGLI